MELLYRQEIKTDGSNFGTISWYLWLLRFQEIKNSFIIWEIPQNMDLGNSIWEFYGSKRPNQVITLYVSYFERCTDIAQYQYQTSYSYEKYFYLEFYDDTICAVPERYFQILLNTMLHFCILSLLCHANDFCKKFVFLTFDQFWKLESHIYFLTVHPKKQRQINQVHFIWKKLWQVQ